MSLFSNKSILILSPQPWDGLRLSKHHYAEELARRSNNVYFVNPPSANQTEFTLSGVSERLSVVSWGPRLPTTLRYRAPKLFEILVRYQIRRLINFIGSIDVVWNFDFNTFWDLSTFSAGIRLHQPVDVLPAEQAKRLTGADLVISISNEILDVFQSRIPNNNLLLVDHGICDVFHQEALRTDSGGRHGAFKVGYFGNLDRPALDRDFLVRMATQYPEMEFHFWGQADPTGPFHSVVSKQTNVYFHGLVQDKTRLVSEARNVDIFVIPYHRDATYDCSNSHKILEYLSMGKVIVSSPIYRYGNCDDLVRMPTAGVLDHVFHETIRNIETYNSAELIRKRKHYAASRSYDKIIDVIESVLLHRNSSPSVTLKST